MRRPWRLRAVLGLSASLLLTFLAIPAQAAPAAARTPPRFFYTGADDLVAGYGAIVQRIDGRLSSLFATLPHLPYRVPPPGKSLGPPSTSAPSTTRCCATAPFPSTCWSATSSSGWRE